MILFFMVKLTEQGQIQGKWQSCSKQEYQRPDLLGGAPQKKSGIIISKVSFPGLSYLNWILDSFIFLG